MPVHRTWVRGNTVYLYVQSEAGNYAVSTKRVGDILEVSQRTPVAANLTNQQVEALFRGQ